jgi:ABC transporter transmembrane region
MRSEALPPGPAAAPQRPGPQRRAMRAVDPRLLRHAQAARGYLAVTVMLGLAVTGLIVVQAALLAHALAAAALGTGAKALAGTLALLLGVVMARAAAAYGGEAAALWAAAHVKSQLRRKLIGHCLRLGPAWLGEQQPGGITALATRDLDALDPYFARYLPQLVLSVLVPAAVVVTVTATDWISGLVIAVTLPLIPLFAVIVGLHTKTQTRRQWRLLAQLSGHFLDVVQGLPTLKVFGRAKAQEQVIARVTCLMPPSGTTCGLPDPMPQRRSLRPLRPGPGCCRGSGLFPTAGIPRSAPMGQPSPVAKTAPRARPCISCRPGAADPRRAHSPPRPGQPPGADRGPARGHRRPWCPVHHPRTRRSRPG